MQVEQEPIKTTEDILALNRDCYCFPVERTSVEQAVLSLSAHADMQAMLDKRANYFASTAVFISQTDQDSMLEQITAIETLVQTEAYQQTVLERASNSSFPAAQAKTKGAFMGYDFHMTPDGPRLIEINSNAGGAFIVNALYKAIGKPELEFDASIANMFASEWALAGRDTELRNIAIVESAPEDQFHYPDMCLAADSLRRQGFKVIITDPEALAYRDGGLYVGDFAVDLVYNRLTDFSLTEPDSKNLRQAFMENTVVVTPAPHHHTLFADKQNLTLMSDTAKLETMGISKKLRSVLGTIPKTIVVTPENLDHLWENRKKYFFKPHAGYGSRAAYRGAKLTKKVWRAISEGSYVAQEFISPSVRAVTRPSDQTELKFDMRIYTYNGRPLLKAARVYQGQTTNLRTEGGGLAPVLLTVKHCEEHTQ